MSLSSCTLDPSSPVFSAGSGRLKPAFLFVNYLTFLKDFKF